MTVTAKNPAIELVEQYIRAANDKAASQGLTKAEEEQLAKLYKNLDKLLEEEAVKRVGETRFAQKASKGYKGRVKSRRPSTRHTDYDEMAQQSKLLAVWEARERSGKFVYDEHEEQTRTAAMRVSKAMKVEERMKLLAANGWEVGQVLTMGKSQVKVLSFSVDRVDNKGELVHGTGKVKVIGIKPMVKDGIATIEGNDKDGFYRKVRVRVSREVKVGEVIKLVNEKLGLFYGEVCAEQCGEPAWVEPASLK